MNAGFQVKHELETSVCIYVDASFLPVIYFETGVHFYVDASFLIRVHFEIGIRFNLSAGFHIRIHLETGVCIEARRRAPNPDESGNRRRVLIWGSVSKFRAIWNPGRFLMRLPVSKRRDM